MAKIKDLAAKAREYFYAENFLDLEDVMLVLAERSPATHQRLTEEFSDIIMEQDLMDEIMEIKP